MRIRVDQLTKRFHNAPEARPALDKISLAVSDGEMVALIGSSGSGKSTLMRHIAGLTQADSGTVTIDGAVAQRDGRFTCERRRIRGRAGMIFQQFNLIGRLSVLTNVLAGRIHRTPLWRTCLMRFTLEDKIMAHRALERVEMHAHAHQRASTLSGGQQQRVAIARTLVQQARIVLADEPIASLDPGSARRVMEVLARIHREDRTTFLISLHQVDYALAYCPRTIALSHGRVIFDGPTKSLDPGTLRTIYGAQVNLPPATEPAGTGEHLLRPVAAV